MSTASRLPSVPTLASMLPSGAEGGKEFARIVNLLLFRTVRKERGRIQIFNDAAGDYRGLDAVEQTDGKNRIVGYQYKFYPSPISAEHRREIEKSLKVAAQANAEGELARWILVTPEDLTESSQRRDGGDLSWFIGLRKKMNLSFEIEHWGHTKLLGLFLEAPAICLFYYPNLVPNGAQRRRSIAELRHLYDQNILAANRQIEFVGMSVYKPEAGRGVPMEDIYIPLGALPESTSELEDSDTRVNPLSFLAPSRATVILGDPGSGKSTMMRFLALSGISTALQQRYNSLSDERLPILVTLRRYADELKKRQNLPILDYIIEMISADFSLSADDAFYAFYLESGQAILLFDGLDELPNPQFKQIVRDRIRSFLISYPGNTAIVTSRIIGYEEPFRFRQTEFAHFRLSRLRLEDIEQFVRDWYRVRIENEREREENVNDLIRIVRDPDHGAIRELAENPLLLTIVALVHRIDAVLPDERVVLYQKCTETLLNTWHSWKFRSIEVRSKGKVERRNRRRMEAIAFWMHAQAGGSSAKERAVVGYQSLMDMLKRHIEAIERPEDEDAADLADEFLDFVKKRAGLLIEVGDQQYSFVHLTFQEYLASSHIITQNESAGLEGIWTSIRPHIADARWHELLRLLVAGLRAEETQQTLIERLLGSCSTDANGRLLELLAGLLTDAVPAAERLAGSILRSIIQYIARGKSEKHIEGLLKLLYSWAQREQGHRTSVESAIAAVLAATRSVGVKTNLLLAGAALDLSDEVLRHLRSGTDLTHRPARFFGRTVLGQDLTPLPIEEDALQRLEQILNLWIIRAPYTNFLATANWILFERMGREYWSRRAFEEVMISLAGGYGPFGDLIYNKILLSQASRPIPRPGTQGGISDRTRVQEVLEVHGWSDRNRIHARLEDLVLSQENSHRAARVHERDSAWFEFDGTNWNDVVLRTGLHEDMFRAFFCAFALQPRVLWTHALQRKLIPQISGRSDLFSEHVCGELAERARATSLSESDAHLAGWYILLEVWRAEYRDSVLSYLPLRHLIRVTEHHSHPVLRVSHALHRLALGEAAAVHDLHEMLSSSEPAYKELFVRTFWSVGASD